MYCPSCGNIVNKALKYCNSCGVRLTHEIEDKDGTPGKMLDNILTTLFLVVMFGFGILVGLVAVLLDNNIKTDVVAVIVIAYIAAILGICFLLARQVPKLIDFKLNAWRGTSEMPSQPRLSPQTTGQLDEYREPVMSVTDHTTKTLDKVRVSEPPA